VSFGSGRAEWRRDVGPGPRVSNPPDRVCEIRRPAFVAAGGRRDRERDRCWAPAHSEPERTTCAGKNPRRRTTARAPRLLLASVLYSLIFYRLTSTLFRRIDQTRTTRERERVTDRQIAVRRENPISRAVIETHIPPDNGLILLRATHGARCVPSAVKVSQATRREGSQTPRAKSTSTRVRKPTMAGRTRTEKERVRLYRVAR